MGTVIGKAGPGRVPARRAYSGKGDHGRTADASGRTLAKDDPRIIAAGKLDLLQSALDAARRLEKGSWKEALALAQRTLGQAAAELSGAPAVRLARPVSEADVERCERLTDSLGEPPRGFVRFDARAAIALNECRVRCRDLETALTPLLRARRLRRPVYAYVNRLSSLLFMLAVRRPARR